MHFSIDVTRIPGNSFSNIESKAKQIPDVRVLRNRAAKNISLRFPRNIFILDITSVTEFILNYIRTAYSIKRVVLNLILDSSYISR